MLSVSDCCDAKLQGKNGTGLEDACAEVTFTPTESGTEGEGVDGDTEMPQDDGLNQEDEM